MDEVWDTLVRGESSLRWFARQAGGGIAGGTVVSPKALSHILSNLRSKWDLYFSINPSSRRSGVRIAASDVTHWRTVLLDVDPMSSDARPQEAALEYLTRAAQALGSDVPHTMIDSGRGVQVHLHLTPFALTGDEVRARVRAAVGAFLRNLAGPSAAPLFGCRLDLSCSDLARVARMPNTVNHKTGRWTTVLFDSSTKLSSLQNSSSSTVGERILALAGPTSHRVDIRPITDGLKYQNVWSRLTATAQRFIDKGSLEGSRHKDCVAAVKSLWENGVPVGETERVVMVASGACQPPLDPSEALRIVRAAYRS